MSMSQAVKEIMWWSYLADDLKLKIPVPCPIFSDSQGAMLLVGQPTAHARTTHIDIKHHYIRELRDRGIIVFIYLPNQNMPANLLTEPLSRDIHARLSERLRELNSSAPSMMSI